MNARVSALAKMAQAERSPQIRLQEDIEAIEAAFISVVTRLASRARVMPAETPEQRNARDDQLGWIKVAEVQAVETIRTLKRINR